MATDAGDLVEVLMKAPDVNSRTQSCEREQISGLHVHMFLWQNLNFICTSQSQNQKHTWPCLCEQQEQVHFLINSFSWLRQQPQS